jgi:hypothetical protein
VDTVIGEWVKAEGGEEGTVVAVAHAGGGTGGWQLLILQPNLRLTAASALNGQVVPPPSPCLRMRPGWTTSESAALSQATRPWRRSGA